jgi:hypothetical protein
MYSQASQDDFVDLVLNNQKNGYFIDVGGGCTDPKTESNSLLFEERGWKGIVVDGDVNRMKDRSCICVTTMIGDGSSGTKKLGDILKENNVPSVVDYLSIDIEGQDFNAVKSFIESGYTFKVATIEHNLYSQNPGVVELKSNIFNLLSLNGYIRVVDNAGHQATFDNLHRGWSFEDWYINPNHAKYKEIIQKLKLKTVNS